MVAMNLKSLRDFIVLCSGTSVIDDKKFNLLCDYNLGKFTKSITNLT